MVNYGFPAEDQALRICLMAMMSAIKHKGSIEGHIDIEFQRFAENTHKKYGYESMDYIEKVRSLVFDREM